MKVLKQNRVREAVETWDDLYQRIDRALLDQIQTRYANARTDGLCHTGAWEIAAQTLRSRTVPAEIMALLEALLEASDEI